MDGKLDGNAAGGILQSIFAFEVTTLESICDRCAHTSMIGQTAVYPHGMGTVVRCPICDNMLMRVAEIRSQYWLDMRGTRCLRLPMQG